MTSATPSSDQVGTLSQPAGVFARMHKSHCLFCIISMCCCEIRTMREITLNEMQREQQQQQFLKRPENVLSLCLKNRSQVSLLSKGWLHYSKSFIRRDEPLPTQ